MNGNTLSALVALIYLIYWHRSSYDDAQLDLKNKLKALDFDEKFDRIVQLNWESYQSIPKVRFKKLTKLDLKKINKKAEDDEY